MPRWVGTLARTETVIVKRVVEADTEEEAKEQLNAILEDEDNPIEWGNDVVWGEEEVNSIELETR